MTKNRSRIADMHPLFKCLFIIVCMFMTAFGMMVGLDYGGKHFKGPKADPAWVQAQDKSCHAQCAARWEVEP